VWRLWTLTPDQPRFYHRVTPLGAEGGFCPRPRSRRVPVQVQVQVLDHPVAAGVGKLIRVAAGVG